MEHTKLYTSSLLGLCLALSAVATGQTPAVSSNSPPEKKPVAARPALIPDPVLVQINEGLKQEDPAAQQQAATQIRALLESEPQKAMGPMMGWIRNLQAAQRFQDVADLSQRAILVAAGNTGSVETFLTFRVQALMAAEKNSESLAAAKQLYNFTSMRATSDAILVVCQVLNTIYPEDRDVLKRYRQEQVEGANNTSTALQRSVNRTLLSDITLDAKPYAKAISQLTAENYGALQTKGNLLLLAGRNQEAWEVFERAYSLASDRDLPGASENMARCMKAQDGTIGRANAWILSIRPKLHAASLQDVNLNAMPTTHSTAQIRN